MRSDESAFRSRALGQVALVVLLAGATAACSGSKRLSEPFFTGSTENQRQIINNNQSGYAQAQPMPAPIQTAAVSSSALPPPSGYGQTQTVAGLPATIDGTTGSPMGTTVPASAYAPAVEPIAEAPSLVATGGSYVVQPGDTLFGIARRNGTTVQSLVSLNGLVSPEAIRIGQTLRLDGSAQPQNTAVAALGAPEKPLGQLRVSSDGTALGAAPAPAPAAAAPVINLPAPADVALGAPKAPAMPAIPTLGADAAAPTTAAATAAIDQAADAASADGKSFRWPVRGRIISGFGTKPNGERNEGINLAVPEGTSIKSVEAGTVIYAGNELEGYGNLILVRHAEGWVSAYAHTKEMMVKRGDTVARGQTVAEAGMTGSVTSPQLHFELRKGSKPVNPLDYLAGA